MKIQIDHTNRVTGPSGVVKVNRQCAVMLRTLIDGAVGFDALAYQTWGKWLPTEPDLSINSTFSRVRRLLERIGIPRDFIHSQHRMFSLKSGVEIVDV